MKTKRFGAGYNPHLQFALMLALACSISGPAAGQNTCTQQQFASFQNPPGEISSITIRPVTTTIIQVFNSKGVLIATYRIRNMGSREWKIEMDGKPYTTDTAGNPDGVYSGDTVQHIVNSICPHGATVLPSSSSRNSGHAADPGLLTTPDSGQAANSYGYEDFNGDGYVDSAAATGSSNVVITLFGAGGATLSRSSIPLPSSQLANKVVTADFNGDGNMDLAVLYASTSPSGQAGVAILLGNGDGTFGAPMELGAGSGPNLYSMAVGDFNGDGKPDPAVAGFVQIDQPFSLTAQLGILLGKGDGTFAPPVMANVQSLKNPESLISADFNGDGNLDLAVLDWRDALPDPDEVWVLPGHGDGTFGAPIGTVPGTGRGYLAYTDLNHDGNVDLLIADPASNGMAILMGKGDGTFQAPTLYAASAQEGGVSLALIPSDDGSTAIFTPDDLTNGILMTFAGSDGTVNSPVIQPLGKGLAGIAAADVNGDGSPDLLITDAAAGNLSVLTGNGNGQFAAPATYTLGSQPTAVASADLNHDGKADAVVADATGIDVLLGDGRGGFAKAVTYPAASGQLSSVALADFNLDGKIDVAAVNSGGLSLFQGKGDGTLAAERVIPLSGGNTPVNVVAADVNGDGKPDLIASFYQPASGGVFTGGFSVMLGAGDGTFAAPMNTLLPGSFRGGLAVADVNGDSVPDLIVSSADQSFQVQISVFLGKGDGTFQTPLATPTGTSGGMLAVTDLDGDGIPDLIVADCIFNGGTSCGASEPSYMLGRGDGTFQPEVRFSAGPGASALVVADFNGDGKPDLAAAGHRTIGERGALTVLANAFSASSNPASGALASQK